MTVGYSAPEDVINAALALAGYPRPIADIYEGSRAARVALDAYGATRDALLREQDWDFAYREVTLATLGGGLPVAGFAFKYVYPADCLRLRQIRGVVPSPDNDPQPVRWLTVNDVSIAPPVKAIAATVANATAAYVGQVTDPALWDPGYTRALVARLAEIFAYALAGDIQLARSRGVAAEQAVAEGSASSDLDPAAGPGLAASASAMPAAAAR